MSLGFSVIGVDNLDKYYDPKLKKNRLRAKDLSKTCKEVLNL